MDEKKAPWESKAMWMGVIGLIALNLKSFGLVDVSAADQATLTDTIVAFIQNGSILLAMVFRYVATKRIN